MDSNFAQKSTSRALDLCVQNSVPYQPFTPEEALGFSYSFLTKLPEIRDSRTLAKSWDHVMAFTIGEKQLPAHGSGPEPVVLAELNFLVSSILKDGVHDIGLSRGRHSSTQVVVHIWRLVK
jgi:hypothetical protein